MPSLRAGALAAALACLTLVSCEVGGAPPVDPAHVALQPGDLPADLLRCPASGDLSAFARSLQGPDPAASQELVGAWHDLQHHGAAQAAVTVYAAQAATCAARVGTGAGTNLTSIVVRFRDGGAATTAYQRGVLGFATPSEDAEVPDMTRGAATGFGHDAWVLERSVEGRSLMVGLWERNGILVLFVAVDADPLHAKQALSAVDARIP
jgi:hypothetical protein